MFAAKGALLPEQQFHQFKKERLKLFFIAQDSADAQERLDAYLMDILTDPEVSQQAKADIAYSTSMKSIREVFQGTNLKTLSELKKISKKIVKMILSDGRVMEDFIK